MKVWGRIQVKIGVIGGGALGLLTSGFLALNSHEVTLYCRREEQKNDIERSGIHIETISQSKHHVKISTGMFPDIQEEELYIVATKQGDLNDLMNVLSTKLHSNQGILFLQNGMSHIQWFDRLKCHVYVGTVEHGAQKISDSNVLHTGTGQINLAYWQGNRDPLDLFNRLHNPTFPIVWKEDGYGLLAWKLIVNAVINPITALFKVKNGTILRNTYLLEIAKNLCKEGSMVLGLSYDESWEYVQKICKRTSENQSSMLKDILNGKQTEIESISGFILEKAEVHAIPNTLFIYHSIKALEEEENKNG